MTAPFPARLVGVFFLTIFFSPLIFLRVAGDEPITLDEIPHTEFRIQNSIYFVNAMAL